MKHLFTLVLAIGIIFNLSATEKDLITHWTFDNTTSPAIGSGTVELIGGTTEHSINPDDGWRFFNFPIQSLNSGTAGAQIMVSTEGYANVVISFEHRSSGTASRWAEYHYTTDGGTTWEVYGHNNGALSPRDTFYPFELNFTGITAVDNNPNFGIRIVSIFSPVPFNPGVPDQNYVAETAYHRARISGGGEYDPGGNWRLRDVRFSGNLILGENPVKLEITSINNENPVYTHIPFDVVVSAYNADDLPAPVATDTEITLTLQTGSGILEGNLSATIPAGSHSVTLADVTYDTAETGVVLSATANTLDPAQSEPFDVTIPSFTLETGINMPGAGVVTGAGEYLLGEEVTIIATAFFGFEFSSWIDPNGVIQLPTDVSYTFEMPASDLSIIAVFDIQTGEDLAHYWHFNDLPDQVFTEVPADYSAFSQAAITFPGTGTGYMDRYDPGSAFNLHQAVDPGFALRVRNPVNTRELIINAPSDGFENLVLTYEVHRSNNGPTLQSVYYSVDAGSSWQNIALGFEIETDYMIKSFPLSMHPVLNNNSDLMFRILLTGDNTTGDQGNQRFDNISVTGSIIEGYTSLNENDQLTNEVTIYPNPATSGITVLVQEQASMVEIYSLSGQLIIQSAIYDGSVNINTSTLIAGVYLVKVITPENKQISVDRLVIE